ncbi:putative two component transcriptional regulator, winged helix family [Kribbella flavida DSM 17836]|uniref:Putative two component transcriptional regulator, winged helix family n=1 Tax=Kribbella flavida (strain DSM 17836 / JCM 10339 / NBRC 14399) TaxID=479435 RepID=D2Q216_KRIFD|nr:winged helix-turn-helix domain-containing protein [Kribbella flavida]ADB33962.1 putative two component transcriptional regulator, winged helix family [Kribbella flavida DSM 17836]
MAELPDSSLIIGVATSRAERVQLARLLSGADALLLVSSPDQARAFLELTAGAASTPVVLTRGVLPPEPAVETSAHLRAATPTPAGDVVGNVVELPAALRLDEDRRVVRWKDREIPLTRLEHDFLHCLVEHPGQVWTYQRLHHAVWGNEHLGHGSHIHSVVKRLRQKLAQLGASVTIQAVRGVGFHLLPAA